MNDFGNNESAKVRTDIMPRAIDPDALSEYSEVSTDTEPEVLKNIASDRAERLLRLVEPYVGADGDFGERSIMNDSDKVRQIDAILAEMEAIKSEDSSVADWADGHDLSDEVRSEMVDSLSDYTDSDRDAIYEQIVNALMARRNELNTRSRQWS